MKNSAFLGLVGTALDLFSGRERMHYPGDVIQGRGSGSDRELGTDLGTREGQLLLDHQFISSDHSLTFSAFKTHTVLAWG